MKNFLMKKLNKKGFTLAELLIVVAIIGVLVAVSIPIFSTQLEKSREHTDEANLRAAKAAAVALFLDNNENAGTYYYDAEQGCLVVLTSEKIGGFEAPVPEVTELDGYGKGRAKVGDKNLEFKMSTNPAYDKAKDQAHTLAYTKQLTAKADASEGGTTPAVGMKIEVGEKFDALYTGRDEVRDCVIHVGIESTAGSSSANAADYIYLEWVGKIVNVTPV